MDPTRVRELREAAELSYERLAEKCGVSWQAVQQVEKGLTRRPRFLSDLARHLDTTPEYLTGETDDPRPLTSRSGLLHTRISGRGVQSEEQKEMRRIRIRMIERILDMPSRQLLALEAWIDAFDREEEKLSPATKGKMSLD